MSHAIIQGDCIAGLRTLPDASVHCCITSPPYWGLRDYGYDGQIGLEETPEAYVARMVEVFREVRRVLRDDGTLWLNLGDCYASRPKGNKTPSYGSCFDGRNMSGVDTSGKKDKSAASGLAHKQLVGIPWRVAFALQADGWWLRQDIIWHKPNPMPESVRDRCTKAHEYVFLLTKSERYFYDSEAVSEAANASHAKRYESEFNVGKKEVARGEWSPAQPNTAGKREFTGTRNRRSVWTVTTKPYSGAHFATMPPDLVEPCIKAGTSEHGCCPDCGSPWVRLTERTKLKRERPNAYTKRHGDAGTGNSCGNDVAGVAVQTVGWQQSCDCDCHTPDVVPCTVLDPFAGSGTTLAVAAELGRNAIGCELNPEYIQLANQRIAKSKAKTPLFC